MIPTSFIRPKGYYSVYETLKRNISNVNETTQNFSAKQIPASPWHWNIYTLREL